MTFLNIEVGKNVKGVSETGEKSSSLLPLWAENDEMLSPQTRSHPERKGGNYRNLKNRHSR